MAELTEDRVREIVREELEKADGQRRVYPEPIQRAMDEILADWARVVLSPRPELLGAP